jgi:hypothetical protein
VVLVRGVGEAAFGRIEFDRLALRPTISFLMRWKWRQSRAGARSLRRIDSHTTGTSLPLMVSGCHSFSMTV